jgi:hypothetical protein
LNRVQMPVPTTSRQQSTSEQKGETKSGFHRRLFLYIRLQPRSTVTLKLFPASRSSMGMQGKGYSGPKYSARGLYLLWKKRQR